MPDVVGRASRNMRKGRDTCGVPALNACDGVSPLVSLGDGTIPIAEGKRTENEKGPAGGLARQGDADGRGR